MNRKFFYLFASLLLPVLVFLFLKIFGKNEFTVPVYFENNADSLNRVCKTHYRSPYALQDSIVGRFTSTGKKAVVFIFGKGKGKELNRLADTFDQTELELVPVGTMADSAELQRLATCVFFIRFPADAVLVDDRHRIRGYYNTTSRNQMDRLIVEIKILLKKY